VWERLTPSIRFYSSMFIDSTCVVSGVCDSGTIYGEGVLFVFLVKPVAGKTDWAGFAPSIRLNTFCLVIYRSIAVNFGGSGISGNPLNQSLRA